MDLTLFEAHLRRRRCPRREGLRGRTGFSSPGPIDAPSFNGSASTSPGLVAYEGWGPVQLELEVSLYEYGALLAQLRFDDDDEGELFESEGSMLVDLVHLAQNPSEAIEALGHLALARGDARPAPALMSSYPDSIRRRTSSPTRNRLLSGREPQRSRAAPSAHVVIPARELRLALGRTSEGLCGSRCEPSGDLAGEPRSTGVTDFSMDRRRGRR